MIAHEQDESWDEMTSPTGRFPVLGDPIWRLGHDVVREVLDYLDAEQQAEWGYR